MDPHVGLTWLAQRHRAVHLADVAIDVAEHLEVRGSRRSSQRHVSAARRGKRIAAECCGMPGTRLKIAVSAVRSASWHHYFPSYSKEKDGERCTSSAPFLAPDSYFASFVPGRVLGR